MHHYVKKRVKINNINDKKILIEEALKNKVIIKNNVKPNLDLEKPAFLIFENAQNKEHRVKPDIYIKILQEIIPTSDKVIEHIIKTSNDLNIYNFNKKLKKWGYDIRNITNESWKKVKTIINNNNKVDKLLKTGIKIEDIGDICKIDEKSLLRDDLYYSKFMRTIYESNLTYTSDISKYFRGKNCEQQRINILFNTDDNGSFYYIYSFYQMKNKIEENKDIFVPR